MTQSISTMKKLSLSAVLIVLPLISLFILWKTFEIPHQEYYEGVSHYPFGRGNATEDIRNNISSQLQLFEKGYIDRDVENLDKFCSDLISKNNTLVLGTMPYEIFNGYDEAKDLLESDWLYWGDVRFLMEEANISVHDSVSWVSTIGYVKFDLSRLLVLPLRFSGIMVIEDSTWKFQQMQFQFDLNNMQILLAIIVLLLITIGFFLRFIYVLIKFLRKKEKA